MRGPDRTTIKGLERCRPSWHVVEPPKPNEPVRVVEVAELPHNPDAHGLLGFDELAIEEFDEHVSLALVEGVLPKLKYTTASHAHILRPASLAPDDSNIICSVPTLRCPGPPGR